MMKLNPDDFDTRFGYAQSGFDWLFTSLNIMATVTCVALVVALVILLIWF